VAKGDVMRALVAELEARRAKALELGGAAKVEAQRAVGKMTVRERIERLFDTGSFTEIGIHATHIGRRGCAASRLRLMVR